MNVVNRQRTKKTAVIVFLLIAFVLGRILVDLGESEANNGRHAFLTEGDYQVVRLVDPITWVVMPFDSQWPNHSRPFRIRLASLEMTPIQYRMNDRNIELVSSLLEPERTVRLRFDRHRFDTDQIPLAYAFVNHALLNAKLVDLNIALPKFLPDNSSKLQRQIARANAPLR